MNELITTDDLRKRQEKINSLGINTMSNAHSTLNRLNNLIYAREVELEELVYSRDSLVKGINNYIS